MALQLDAPTGGNLIHRIEPGCVWINGQAWREPVLVPWQGVVRPWGVRSFDTLQAEHFDQLREPRPELILFGSGQHQRFVPPALLQGLMQAGIGLDTMGLAAACRTFNVLTAENRHVLAALLLD